MKKLHTSFTLIVLILSTQIYAKTLIISDIDDTLRQSNVVYKPDAAFRLLGTPEPFKGLRSLFVALKNQASEKGDILSIAYISSSTPLFYNAKAWLEKKHFPVGEVVQRDSIFQDSRRYKLEAINRFLDLNYDDGDEVLFFGDNAELDPGIYLEVTKLRKLSAQIFIRDIKAITSIYSPKKTGHKMPGIHYFGAELELLLILPFKPFAGRLKNQLQQYLKAGNSLPKYLKDRIAKQLKKCNFPRFSTRYYYCRVEADKLANNWMKKVNLSLYSILGIEDKWLMASSSKI